MRATRPRGVAPGAIGAVKMPTGVFDTDPPVSAGGGDELDPGQVPTPDGDSETQTEVIDGTLERTYRRTETGVCVKMRSRPFEGTLVA